MPVALNPLESVSDFQSTLSIIRGNTAIIIGAAGSGKSWLARQLVAKLAEQGDRTAFVSADMGQPSVGVPTCLGLATSPPWDRSAVHWFVGDTTPVGNLLPTVVGTARLVERARYEGARSIVIDTGGLVEGSVARILKYHKVVAAGVTRVVAVQRLSELQELTALLEQPGGGSIHCRSSPYAYDRSTADRKVYRQRCYAEHFARAQRYELDARLLIERDWTTGTSGPHIHALPGTVVGLLDRFGYCLALGLVDALRSDRITVVTSWHEQEAIARLQLGRIRLRRADFEETRSDIGHW
jgi:polynucleotide 5'-kinase involved in rRNA processing